ncbi:MAG: hypothetical protein QM817_24950 [Archangium sp.]
MREGMVDDVRVRSEGGVERLEEAASRFRRATMKCDAGFPDAMPQLTSEESEALANVGRLEPRHESVLALQEARQAFERSVENWNARFGLKLTREQLPVRHAGQVWFTEEIPVSRQFLISALVGSLGGLAAGLQFHWAAAGVFAPIALLTFMLQRRRSVQHRCVLTARELIVGERTVALADVREVRSLPDGRILVQHEGGTLGISAGEDSALLLKKLEDVLRERAAQ